MPKYSLLFTAVLATLQSSGAAPLVAKDVYVYPNIADTSHASPQVTKFFHGYFTAKTTGNQTGLLDYYNPHQTEYYDSTLGLTLAANRSQLVSVLGAPTSPKPGAASYPLRILGNIAQGAIVYFVDNTELFGSEIRTITSFDFLNGTIRRQLDGWDARGNSAKAAFGGDPEYPYDLGLAGIPENAAREIQIVSRKLNDALSTGNVTAATALFDYDAVFEDLTLRARLEGQVSIGSYLHRALKSLPYGPGTNVTHVVGSAEAGGYEWRPSGNPIHYGITALELDCSGKITRFTTVWDGSLLSEGQIQTLAEQVPTP